MGRISNLLYKKQLVVWHFWLLRGLAPCTEGTVACTGVFPRDTVKKNARRVRSRCYKKLDEIGKKFDEIGKKLPIFMTATLRKHDVGDLSPFPYDYLPSIL